MRKLKAGIILFLCVLIVGCSKSNKIHTVTFRNGNQEYKVDVNDKKAVKEIETPTKDGYRFIGWYVDDKPYDFSSEITKDVTLVAKWEKIEDTTSKVETNEDNNESKEENSISSEENKQSEEIKPNNSVSNNTQSKSTNTNNSNTSNNQPKPNTNNSNTSNNQLKPNTNSSTNNNQQNNNQVKPQNTIKTIEENETIPFSASTQNEVNMLRGTTQVIQNGENGIKTITYKVTYDPSGKEISREKISEKVTKQPTDQITKVGISDYNLNSDIYSYNPGYMCTKDYYVDFGGGYMDCTGEENIYTACILGLKSGFYLIDPNACLYQPVPSKPSYMIKAERIDATRGILTVYYNGQEYYYINGGGTGGIPLTQYACDAYDLACGRW